MITRPRTWGCAFAAVLLPAVGSADEVLLRGGGRVAGVIVERTDRMVVLETGPGRVGVPLSRVEAIHDGGSALLSFQERAERIDPLDVAGWARLARWAEDHHLATTARETWERVVALDPDHPEANAALGRSFVDGAWMDEAAARRRQGYVPWNGGWVTPPEHEALVRERAADRQDARERREAELRVREAEARAREAEARAREAEANAEQSSGPVEGIPYQWVIYGGAGGGWNPGGAGCCRPPHLEADQDGDSPAPGPPTIVRGPQASIGPAPGATSRARATSGAIGAPRTGGSRR